MLLQRSLCPRRFRGGIPIGSLGVDLGHNQRQRQGRQLYRRGHKHISKHQVVTGYIGVQACGGAFGLFVQVV
jgi:hypothetical protein